MKNLSILIFFLITLLLSGEAKAQGTAVGTVTNVHCHGDSTGSISYHISGGPAPVRYVWNTGDSGVSVGGCTYTVRITNPGAALTNFQLRVDLVHASGMAANFSNVIFTDSLNNPIPFWLQDFPTATNATFWVRVPAIPSGGSIIYLSFCGSQTVSTGSANATFEFFDNFDSGTYGTWTAACNTPMAGSSCTASASNTVYFSPGYSAYLSATSTCFTPPYSGAGSTISHTVNPIVNDSLVIDYNDKIATTLAGFCSGGTGSTNSSFADNISLGNGQSNSQGGSCNTNTSGWANETSQPFRVTVGQTTIKLQTYGGDCDNSQGWFDNVRIRKYRAHPPTIVIDTTPQLLLDHLAAGTYTITMTAANGATSTNSFVVTEPTAIAPQLDSDNVTCLGFNNGKAWVSSLGGTPGYTYLWDNAQTSDTIRTLVAGIYQVTVTDTFGCRDSASVNITEPATSVSATMDSMNVFCKGQATGKAWVTGAGGTPGYTYVWNNTATTDTIRGLLPAQYTVQVTDAAGCTTTGAVNITEPANPLTASIDSTNVLCKGDATGKAWATALGGTPGYTYLWSNTQAGDTIRNLIAGPYSVIATDTLGCTATAAVNITEPNNPLSIVLDSNNITCKGFADGKAWVTASGGTAGYTYQWSNTQTADTIRNLTDGVYTIQVRDANGCTVGGVVNILPSTDTVIISASVTDATCGLANGAITITPSGGSSPYQYTWSSGPPSPTLSGVNGGTYAVTVKDNFNCSSSSSINVLQYPALTDAVQTLNDTCHQSLGRASVTVTTGTPPYTYLWSTNVSASYITAVPAGNYDVTITDSISCTLTTPVVIGNIDILPDPSFGATDTPVCGGAILKLSPGTFTSYIWQDHSTAAVFSISNKGVYSVTVTNAYGCENSVSITVTDYCNSAVLFPTGFSPNGDGTNDIFHAIYTPDLRTFHMTIYDRWGVLVFETSDYRDGWDGKYKNVAQPIGTYVWFADYTFDKGGPKTQSGNITLLR